MQKGKVYGVAVRGLAGSGSWSEKASLTAEEGIVFGYPI